MTTHAHMMDGEFRKNELRCSKYLRTIGFVRKKISWAHIYYCQKARFCCLRWLECNYYSYFHRMYYILYLQPFSRFLSRNPSVASIFLASSSAVMARPLCSSMGTASGESRWGERDVSRGIRWNVIANLGSVTSRMLTRGLRRCSRGNCTSTNAWEWGRERRT